MHVTTFSRMISAAHRIPGDPGKCRRLHGHNYHITVKIAVDVLDENNFTIAFDHVKKVIDQFDHKVILANSDMLKIQLFEEDERFLSATSSWVDMTREWVVRVPSIPSSEFITQHIANLILEAVKDSEPPKNEVHVMVSLSETPSVASEAGASWTRSSE